MKPPSDGDKWTMSDGTELVFSKDDGCWHDTLMGHTFEAAIDGVPLDNMGNRLDDISYLIDQAEDATIFKILDDHGVPKQDADPRQLVKDFYHAGEIRSWELLDGLNDGPGVSVMLLYAKFKTWADINDPSVVATLAAKVDGNQKGASDERV